MTTTYTEKGSRITVYFSWEAYQKAKAARLSRLLLFLAFIAFVPKAKAQPRVYHTTDSIGTGMQFTMNGYHYYKLKRNTWVVFPGINAKPYKPKPLQFYKGKYLPIKVKGGK